MGNEKLTTDEGPRIVPRTNMEPWQGCVCSSGVWLAKEQRWFKFKLRVKRILRLLWPLVLVGVGFFIGRII